MNRLVLIIMCITAAAFLMPVHARAENKTAEVCGFEMTECAETEEVSKLRFNSDPANGIIEHFAVSEEGMTAIGYHNYVIDVYDTDMEFLYSIKPSYTRSSYFLIWENEQLCIFVDSTTKYLCCIVSGNGEYTEYDISDTGENRHRYLDMKGKTYSFDKYGRNYYVEDNRLIREDSRTLEEKKAGRLYFDPALLLLPGVLYFLYHMLFKHDPSNKTYETMNKSVKE